MSCSREEVSITQQTLHQGYMEIWHHGLFHIKSSALLCAVGLGIPSAIHRRGGAATISDIVSDTGVDPSKISYLRRLMRMLTFYGIFAAATADQPDEAGETIYTLTPVSQILVEDRDSTPYDMSPLLRVIVRPSTAVSTFFSMEEWFRDAGDKTLFEVAHGVHPWTLTKNDPEYNKAVNESMVMDSSVLMDIMLEVGSSDIFRGIKSLVDVGGGLGVAAMAIARAFPHIKCTVLDLEQVISQAPSSDGSVEFVTGDMFEYIPPADAVFLKLIFDCWDDEDSVKILRQCKRAIPGRDAGGKVIIVNCVLGYGPQDNVAMETQVLFDVYMMRYDASFSTSGAQREEHEWKKIFVEAGFSDYKITPIFGFQSIIEEYPF
ncbi:unnamed protein product [Urochloa decumbens]|uniref:Uncharacterized protein n=1 Tax=Urochloa decumbens TaxID=240449 RepID=A0ABC9C083_9POAL